MRVLRRAAVLAFTVAGCFGFALAVQGGFVETLIGLGIVVVCAGWGVALYEIE